MALLFAEPPVLRRFENDLDTGKIQLEWTRIGRDFYFRPKNARIELVWCHLGRGGYASDLLRAKPAISIWTTQKIKRSLANFDVWRAAFVEDCDLFFRDDFGVVRLQGKKGGEQEFARFELLNPFSSSHNKLASAVELQRIIEDSLPEIELLKDILKSPPEQRILRTVHWPWGTQQELEKLLRAMATIIRQPQHSWYEWYYYVANRFREPIITDPRYVNPQISGLEHNPFLSCLKRYFPVEVSELTIYTIHNIESYDEMNYSPIIKISKGMPTSHEKIEAWMLWQDFLTEKIPPAEIEKLRDSVQI